MNVWERSAAGLSFLGLVGGGQGGKFAECALAASLERFREERGSTYLKLKFGTYAKHFVAAGEVVSTAQST